VLAVALEPGVQWLTRHRVRRAFAAIIVSAITIAIIAGVLALVITPLALQSRQLVEGIPNVLRDATGPGSPLHFLETRYHVVERVQHPQASDFRWLLGARQSLTHAVTTTLSIVAAVLSVFVIMVLLLVEGPRSWAGFLSLLHEEQRERVARLGDRMQHAVGGYVRGNFLISLIAGSAAWIAMMILHVPHPVPLAVMVGILDIVPLIGATIGAVICVLVAISQGWVIAIVLLIFFLVYQQVENNVLQPVVYSKTVALSPLTVLVASLAGAAVAGIVGVLIAIPLASAAYILVQDLIERRQEEVTEEDAEAQAGLASAGEPAAADAEAAVVDAPGASERGLARGGPQTLRDMGDESDAAAREIEEAKGAPSGVDDPRSDTGE
jgi:predicted PurR-regulated permease PerM